MSSFVYPKNLLHKLVEPQWFSKSNEMKESSLNALEAAEEDFQKKLESVIEAPTTVIGLNHYNNSSSRTTTTPRGGGGRRSSSGGDTVTRDDHSMATATPVSQGQPRFWNRTSESPGF